MDTIVNMQFASGAFAWGTGFEKFLKMTREEAQEKMKHLLPEIEERTRLTLLAIAILEVKFGAEKSMWELIAKKAEKWLLTKQQVDVNKVDMEKFRTFVRDF